ncbi:hypothetical protein NQZ68_007545 [Dissostichus eleginoides]|nr:hypothetical protein NQZ68_007545 [Dissostichus eleginoides]
MIKVRRHGGGRPHLDSSLLTTIGQLEFERPAWLSHYAATSPVWGHITTQQPLSLSEYRLHPVLSQKAQRFKAACTASSLSSPQSRWDRTICQPERRDSQTRYSH